MFIAELAQLTKVICKLYCNLGRLQKNRWHVCCQRKVKVMNVAYRVISVVQIRPLDAVWF